MARKTKALIKPSPMPMSIWTPVMAGKPTDQGMVPDQANWPAQLMAANTVAAQPANARALTRPRTPGNTALKPR